MWRHTQRCSRRSSGSCGRDRCRRRAAADPTRRRVDAFVASLEAALDRAAAAAPNPGRVASRRLNRAEYVNVDSRPAGAGGRRHRAPAERHGRIRLRQQRRRAVDHAGADGALHRRRHQDQPDGGGEPRQPADHAGVQGRVRTSRRSARATTCRLPRAAAWPFATRSRSTANTCFALRLKRNGTVSTIDGIEEDQHEIEVRVDHALVKRFQDRRPVQGSRSRRVDSGSGRRRRGAEGPRLPHERRQGAGVPPADQGRHAAGLRGVHRFGSRALEREPACGTSLASATDSCRASTCCTSPDRSTGNPGPTRRAASASSPAGPRRRATKRAAHAACSRPLARRAYRRPVTDADMQPLLAIYQAGRAARDFDAGIERALEAMLSSPKFLIRVEREPAGAQTRNSRIG